MCVLGRFIVDAVVLQRRSPTDLAREHGISRRWIHKLVKRFNEGGYPALEPRSRRPHSCLHQTAPDVQARILQLRQELVADGHDAGPPIATTSHSAAAGLRTMSCNRRELCPERGDWQGRKDSNPRPSVLETDALTRLSYAPTGRRQG